MKPVIAFKSERGSLFDTEEAAMRSDSLEAFRKWYETEANNDRSIARHVYASDMHDWLLKHREWVADFLEAHMEYDR